MNARRLLFLATLVATIGCATTVPGPAPHHSPVKATTGGAFEAQTLYSCTGSTGNQLVFAKAKSFVSVLVRTGVLWVKPHSIADTSGSMPSSPIPSANAVANGWVRLGDNQGVSWGIETSVAGQGPNSDALGFLDVWCETQGDLVVVAH